MAQVLRLFDQDRSSRRANPSSEFFSEGAWIFMLGNREDDEIIPGFQTEENPTGTSFNDQKQGEALGHHVPTIR